MRNEEFAAAVFPYGTVVFQSCCPQIQTSYIVYYDKMAFATGYPERDCRFVGEFFPVHFRNEILCTFGFHNLVQVVK